MPDPALYLQAMCVAAGTSAGCVLLFGRLFHTLPALQKTSLLVGTCIGILLGFWCLQIRFTWPPINALDRLLTLILPTVVLFELAASFCPSWSRWFWGIRFLVSLVTPRILLHQSAYIGEYANAWTWREAAFNVTSCGLLLALFWSLLTTFAHRTADSSMLFVTGMTFQTAAAVIMLTGYVTGGEVALIFAASLFGGGSLLLQKTIIPIEGTVSAAAVGLFGLLMIGRFFGGLTTLTAILFLSTPLLCWLTEAPLIHRQPHWRKVLLRFVLIAMPLSGLFMQAKWAFDRKIEKPFGIRKSHETPRHAYELSLSRRASLSDEIPPIDHGIGDTTANKRISTIASAHFYTAH